MAFDGFSKATVRFLAGLRAHNEKAWFDAHREDYERDYLAPAQAFVEKLGPRLRKIDPDVQAEPRVNGSILRIFRDVRFSKDKTPYKDHMDLWFWTGDRKGWDSSGFFFRLTPCSSARACTDFSRRRSRVTARPCSTKSAARRSRRSSRRCARKGSTSAPRATRRRPRA